MIELELIMAEKCNLSWLTFIFIIFTLQLVFKALYEEAKHTDVTWKSWRSVKGWSKMKHWRIKYENRKTPKEISTIQ